MIVMNSDPPAASGDLVDSSHRYKTDSSQREVGIIDPHYGLERVSYGLNLPEFVFRKINRVPIHRLERRGTFWSYTPLLLDRQFDLVHTFNMIPMNARRYVVSCEMELPRYLGRTYSWQQKLGHRALASSSCRSILTLSQIACDQAKAKFEQLNLSEISHKVQVFRGAIRPALNPRDRTPNTDGPIRLLFVGRDAPRKGIVPTLDAVEKLRRSGVDVTLTVVSALSGFSDYVFGEYAPNLNAIKERMDQAPWITYFSETSNQQVREMMREHDALILPTFDESLGWVFVEAAAESCPAITTNIFAIPELVDDSRTGYLLNLPKNHQRRWVGLFLEGKEKQDAIESANESLRDQIVSIVSKLNNDRNELCNLGNSARTKIASMYDFGIASETLKQIYSNAIG